MEYRTLGRTGLKVSRLCFGSLTIGPLQAKLSVEAGARVLLRAFEQGVNFVDTAMLYRTYPYIRKALELYNGSGIILSSKSYDYTYDGMQSSVEETMAALGVKKLGIFSLHEQESKLTLKGHRDALAFLCDAKKAGLIDAVGVSTHAIEVVHAAAQMEQIDVIHPIINYKGLGILDGGVEDMLEAIAAAHLNGKGIYGMKVLGGGNLMGDAAGAFRFALDNENLDAIAVGMQSAEEVDVNIKLFGGETPDGEAFERLKSRSRRLHIDEWCEGCGDCVRACQNNALSIEGQKAAVNQQKCVLCGYCSAYCKQFCIKMV